MSTPSCDKTLRDCNRWNNVRNFGGNTSDDRACPKTFGSLSCGVRADLFDHLSQRASIVPVSVCDECWGTGYYKGWGVVCSVGCKPPTT